MKALIAYGSKRGGTEGIAETLAEALRAEGIDVDVRAANRVADVSAYDAVIIGGSLYANRWNPHARRLVRRRAPDLRERPVWLFSSGPLDDSATTSDIPPVRHVEKAIERSGAREHVTFGGALAPDAEGFPAAAMARDRAGDWRDTEQIRRWGAHIAADLQTTAEER